ncbi:hypothetical protein [Saccharibacillus sp. JS10]|nr:hypothetical protein [Saccharibacillus sp. JS10]MCQ4088753.1 hypothetical protein [Saccharibacillus sp. JS10]
MADLVFVDVEKGTGGAGLREKFVRNAVSLQKPAIRKIESLAFLFKGVAH